MSGSFKKAMMSGQAGVARVASELLLRGIDILFPAVDSGTDLCTSIGLKIQVKSSHLQAFGVSKLYHFKQGERVPTFHRNPDAWACLGWDEERFWIFPTELLEGKNSCYASPNSKAGNNLLDGWEARWDLLGTTPEDYDKTRLDGQAGVYRVASELLRKGTNVSIPMVDCGYDLLTEGGIRIQVKTTERTDSGAVKFCLRDSNYGENKRAFKANSDVTVLWLVGSTDFWIVTSSLLRGKTAVTLTHEQSGYSDVDVSTIKRMRSEGLSLERISKDLGVGINILWRREKYGANPPEKYRFNQEVRSGKDHWDLITGHARLMAASEAECSPTQVSVNV